MRPRSGNRGLRGPGRTRPRWLIPALTLGSILAAAPGARAEHGAAGAGDPLLPKAGSGGYDVSHYDLSLRWRPQGNRLSGRATITARTTQRLSRFHLDLRKPLEVRGVSVGGARAAFTQRHRELVITPPTALPSGTGMRVQVRYRGTPAPIEFPGPGPVGWIKAGRRAWVANEPDAASTWYPANDHPIDKATYQLRIDVPRDLTAVSNGELVRSRRHGKRRTFTWRIGEPIASYLLTATIGRFRTATPKVAGIPSYFAWKRSLHFKRTRLVRTYRGVMRFFSRKFGPYPFHSTGAIVFGDLQREVSYVLETQNRPLFQEDPARGGDKRIVVHELAHQWFGDSVTHSAWDELWLNEGFATWAEWLWQDRKGRRSLEQSFKNHYLPKPEPPLGGWKIPIGAVENPEQIANAMVYFRGAMTLEALREKVGDRTFFRILREWVAGNRYGNVTTEQFITLAESESGLDLERFFYVWLFRKGWPHRW